MNLLEKIIRLLRIRFSRAYKAIKSNDYSLKAIGNKMNIEPNKTFYALDYILPYEKDGWKYWCVADSSGEDVINWGEKFGIKHYLVFEMKFN
ncbi:hypothetical protein [Winogradskyella sp.]|uniref:hypothetical protein n=1 Tax=Winogradskyella sp. TaxID=1883156 RepID=UPI003BA84B4C